MVSQSASGVGDCGFYYRWRQLFLMPYTIDTRGRNYQYVIILLTKTSIRFIFGNQEDQHVIGNGRKKSDATRARLDAPFITHQERVDQSDQSDQSV